MKLTLFAPVAAWGAFAILTSSAYGALPLAHPGATVNDYTAAQSEHAEAAAQSADFGGLEIVMVQDGNFFPEWSEAGPVLWPYRDARRQDLFIIGIADRKKLISSLGDKGDY